MSADVVVGIPVDLYVRMIVELERLARYRRVIFLFSIETLYSITSSISGRGLLPRRQLYVIASWKFERLAGGKG